MSFISRQLLTPHRLSDSTREHVLLLLFRLTLDVSLTSDPTICSELEKAITVLFQSIPEEADDDLVSPLPFPSKSSVLITPPGTAPLHLPPHHHQRHHPPKPSPQTHPPRIQLHRAMAIPSCPLIPHQRPCPPLPRPRHNARSAAHYLRAQRPTL